MYTGGTEATASIYLSVAFIYSTKQNKTMWLFSNFGEVTSGAVSLLLNLGAAQQGRSMLFPDEQKLLFEGGEKGFAKNTKLDFMSS